MHGNRRSPLYIASWRAFKKLPGIRRERDGEGKRTKVKHRANRMRAVLPQLYGKFAEAPDPFRLPGFVLEFIQIAFREVRKRESRDFKDFWTPAFAGVTIWGTSCETVKGGQIFS
jgi:hypothetical protein